jgi:NAD-dependent dihydropyrimidine dehydrogenase PreA subunit
MSAPRKALPLIDPERCTGCGWCVAVCAPHVLHLESDNRRKTSTLSSAPDCTGCALCALRCPFDAIVMMRRETVGASDMPPSQVTTVR